jgi:hypothetical protein
MFEYATEQERRELKRLDHWIAAHKDKANTFQRARRTIYNRLLKRKQANERT